MNKCQLCHRERTLPGRLLGPVCAEAVRRVLLARGEIVRASARAKSASPLKARRASAPAKPRGRLRKGQRFRSPAKQANRSLPTGR
jgi:hypothetical protein